MVRRRAPWLWSIVALVATSASALAAGEGPVLHEQIPADPHEDLALKVSLEGDIPAALETKSGVVSAPDPRRPVQPNDTSYATPNEDRSSSTFTPDRNTKRPDVQGYDDPFTPSTAPFKRLEAFDAVSPTYELYVRDKRLHTLATNAQPLDASEDQFYGDMVVDVAPGRKVRIPSVAAGARIRSAHLTVDGHDRPLHVWRDGAENWFAEGYGAPARARLVLVLTVPRGAFGGELADPSWPELPKIPPLPENVARSAREVSAAIGVGSQLRPRENLTKLVTYFRSFADSEDPPRGRGDIYLDLALSRKGVCRHRAFAFMITAQHLGIPTRMLINEAHAWVEIHDGTMWRRIDLGGAGRMVNPASNTMAERPAHQAPPDAFTWPQGSERGEDMVEQARQRARDMQSPNGQPGNGGNGQGPAASPSASPSGSGASLPPASSGSSNNGNGPGKDDPKDERPASSVSIQLNDPNAHRGAPLHVSGEVKADGEVCSNVMVEVLLRDPRDGSKLLSVGSVATNDKGTYAAAIVVPGTIPLGDYDLVARTAGDARCGRGWSGP